MLVLSRKKGEQVRIGRHIQVTVLETRHGKVKLGFSGPSEVPIHREELLCEGQSQLREDQALATSQLP